jgi:hypothetical protein
VVRIRLKDLRTIDALTQAVHHDEFHCRIVHIGPT